MAKTDLKIKSTNAATGASITTSVTYVNPDANSATLKQFATKLNAFTTNSYAQADRVHTINVDTEDVPIVPTPKESPNLTIGNWVWHNQNGYEAPISYEGDGHVTLAVPPDNTAGTSSSRFGTDIIYTNNKASTVRVIMTTQSTSPPITVYISVSETELYSAQSITSTING